MNLNSFRTLGRSGLRVSPITLGAMTFGDGSWGADDETSAALLDRYLEAGGNFIDTANAYNGGRSEETIGAYLDKHPGLRDRLVIATKFGAGMFPGDPNGGGAGRKAIMQQVEWSLRRLRTDYSPEGSGRGWHAARRLNEETFVILDLLRRIGDELGAPPAAVALAWVRQQPEVTSAIIGTRTVGQLDANLASLDVTIPDPQLAELDQATRPQLDFPADLLQNIAPSYQQAGATINGVQSTEFRR